MDDIVLAAGSANRPLFQAIADRLQLPIDHDTVLRFSDGEILRQFGRSVTDRDVVIVTATPSYEDWEELYQMIDAARRGSARRISVIFTYCGSARQDRKHQPRVPISAAMHLRIIERMGVWRIVLLDPHNVAMQGFVDCPCDIVYARQVIVEHLRRYGEGCPHDKLPVIYSTDAGGAELAGSYANRLGWQRGFGFKVRRYPNRVERAVNIGPVKERTIVFADDLVDTAGTVCAQARVAKKRGAARVVVAAAHAVLSGPASQRLAESDIDELVLTNSLPIPREKLEPIERAGKSATVLPLDDLLARVVQACAGNGSMSAFFA